MHFVQTDIVRSESFFVNGGFPSSAKDSFGFSSEGTAPYTVQDKVDGVVNGVNQVGNSVSHVRLDMCRWVDGFCSPDSAAKIVGYRVGRPEGYRRDAHRHEHNGHLGRH